MPSVKTSLEAQIELNRYSWYNRHMRTTKSRLDYGQRMIPHMRQPLIPTQKANHQLEMQEHQRKFKAALAEAMCTIWALAKSLAAQFPGHNMKYYFEMLMQHRHFKSVQCRVNPWNTFLSSKKAQLACKCAFSFSCNI